MNAYRIESSVAGAILITAAAATVAAQQFDLDWFTIGNGGAMRCAGGGFELSGSIGQPTASEPPPLSSAQRPSI